MELSCLAPPLDRHAQENPTATTYVAGCGTGIPKACKSFIASCTSKSHEISDCIASLSTATSPAAITSASCSAIPVQDIYVAIDIDIDMDSGGLAQCDPLTAIIAPEALSISVSDLFEQKCTWEGAMTAAETVVCDNTHWFGLQPGRSETQVTFTRSDLVEEGGLKLSTVDFTVVTAVATTSGGGAGNGNEGENGDDNEGLANSLTTPGLVAFAAGAANVFVAAVAL